MYTVTAKNSFGKPVWTARNLTLAEAEKLASDSNLDCTITEVEK